tara:strand:+ start:127 stop:714 length:588 start_codon:yes stop_codon:yes gene_type:complete
MQLFDKEKFLDKVVEIVKDTRIELNEPDIFNFLQNEKRWPVSYPWNQRTVEVITNIDNGIGVSNFSFFNARGYLDYYKWKKFYNLGYTTIIANVLDLDNQLRVLQDKLEKHVGKQINANFYFSKSSLTPIQKPSLSDHQHPYDVVVKQIYGQTVWKINNEYKDVHEDDVLLIPRNTVHSVVSSRERKLSLTINIE